MKEPISSKLRTPLDLPIGLLALMTPVSLYVTPDLVNTTAHIVGLLAGIALYYSLIWWLRGGGKLGWVLGGYLAAGTLVGVIGLFGTEWPNKFWFLNSIATSFPPLIQQWFPTLGAGFNPNEVAGALVCVVPLQLVLLAPSRLVGEGHAYSTGFWKAVILVSLFVTGGTLFLTQSRGGLAALLVSAAWLVWLFGSRVVKRLILGLLLAAIVAGAALFALVGLESLVEGQAENYETGFNSLNIMRSVTGRVDIWASVMRGISDYPVTGIGMSAYEAVITPSYFAHLHGTNRSIPQAPHAQNHLLQAGLDLGVPGLVAYIAIWIIITLMVVKARRERLVQRQSARGTSYILLIGASAGLLAYFIFGLGDTIVLGDARGIFFWALLGLLAASVGTIYNGPSTPEPSHR